MQSGPLWILSWDGATPWLAERALAEGALPNLQRMRARGTSSAGSRPDHPDVATPPGHAMLWTGHRASEHGITSFKLPALPASEHTLLESVSGFDAKLLLKDPLWVTAARAGLTSTLVHAPLSGPVDTWQDPNRYPGEIAEKLRIFHGYGPQRFFASQLENPKLRKPQDWKDLPFSLAGAREFQYRAKGLSLPTLVLRGADGRYNRLYVARDKRPGSPGVFVESGEGAGFSEFLEVEPGVGVRLRLFHLSPDAHELTLYSSDGFELECHSPVHRDDYVRAVGGFLGGGCYRLYGDKSFGLPYQDGEAESRYMETLSRGVSDLISSSVWCATNHPSDLQFFYNPGIDEAQHMWAGYVQEGMPSYDAEKEKIVWPLLREAYQKADEHLGALLDVMPKDGTMFLVSDHGITGIHRHFLPNVVLRKAGLLHTKKGNPYRIDLTRTRAIYHPANNSYVFLNTVDHLGGIVPLEEKDALLEEVREALQAVKDPETGEAVLAHTIPVENLPEDSELRGQGRGDLFLALRPGYSLGETLHRHAVLPAHLAGHHQQHPGLACNHALFECAGPRIRRGHSIGIISHQDIHETARSLLGLDPGEGGGEVLVQLLEDA